MNKTAKKGGAAKSAGQSPGYVTDPAASAAQPVKVAGVPAPPLVSAPPATQTEGTGVVEQPMVTPPPKKADKLTRGGTSAGRPGQIVTAANRWRENYNPLRNLTIRRAVELLELGERGDTAYLQWTYRFIEMMNPTLSGLISRCEAPLAGFDWHIKIKTILPTGATKEQADKQKQTLELAYDGIDNLRQALLHLHKADFRGYAHLQKHRHPDGSVYHLEPLHQWCLCRDGLEGNWFWNPDSRATSAPLQFLGKAYCIGGDNLPLADFIIREVARPVNRIALIDTIRRGLVDKDWDGFIEIYGIPGGVVTMPPNVPQGKEGEYEAAARSISEGAAGALPYGSTYTPNDGPANVDPFTPRLARLDEQLILAGTGGKLAMLTEKSGNSRGNSKVHDKSFGEIADGRAKACAEEFNRQFDAEVLNREHPGEPHLVYFDFGAEEEEDVDSLFENVATAKQAGKTVNTVWLAEKSGYEFDADEEPDDDDEADDEADPEKDDAPTPAPGLPKPAGKVKNRATASTDELVSLLHEMVLPIQKRLAAIAEVDDAGIQQHLVAKLLKDFPAIARAISADASLAPKLSPVLAHSLITGLGTNPAQS